jgi:hypothetical protein
VYTYRIIAVRVGKGSTPLLTIKAIKMKVMKSAYVSSEGEQGLTTVPLPLEEQPLKS